MQTNCCTRTEIEWVNPLLVFIVKLYKIKIKTIQKVKPRIWKMKGSKHAQTLTKTNVCAIFFFMQDIRRNDLPKFIDIMLVSL